MKAQVRWMDGFTFLGQSESGHSIVMDGNKGATAPSPMEMVLMGAGGCSSVDVIDGLKKHQQHVFDCNAELTAERRETAPRIFTEIHIHFVVTGKNLNQDLVAQVTKDSLEKYCSVCIMLGAGVKMSHSWEVVEVE
ncbi:OsmC family protein [Vibrio viridaestus]|uniref:OsmC family protein n=1 Tax=Vibrio viridaestus TaxID=2487322 RepID=A0A3N9U3U6_9VIBR|nr:OsmC family protein [Vibrio viridaestus]RQW62696.1 OsmC family protein [Vibrio viridaestus]